MTEEKNDNMEVAESLLHLLDFLMSISDGEIRDVEQEALRCVLALVAKKLDKQFFKGETFGGRTLH
jgi:hypothetical protein